MHQIGEKFKVYALNKILELQANVIDSVWTLNRNYHAPFCIKVDDVTQTWLQPERGYPRNEYYIQGGNGSLLELSAEILAILPPPSGNGNGGGGAALGSVCPRHLNRNYQRHPP